MVQSLATAYHLAKLAVLGALVTVAPQGGRELPPIISGRQDMLPVVSRVDAPAGTEALGVQWVSVAVPGLGVMLAAVARPEGVGPFPALLILHGSHGFASQYVKLAQSIARGGVLGVAACWFKGGRGAGSRFITPIACPEAPPIADASSPAALRAVNALVQAVRHLPDVRSDRVALFGHSRGGGASLNYVLPGATAVRAVVLNSAGYPAELATRVTAINVPFLMLHGVTNSPADGGSAFSSVQMARDFEAALRRAGKRVEAAYYQEGGHNSLFTTETQYDDEVRRITAFLRRYLFD